jgi:hypothetical protein
MKKSLSILIPLLGNNRIAITAFLYLICINPKAINELAASDHTSDTLQISQIILDLFNHITYLYQIIYT